MEVGSGWRVRGSNDAGARPRQRQGRGRQFRREESAASPGGVARPFPAQVCGKVAWTGAEPGPLRMLGAGSSRSFSAVRATSFNAVPLPDVEGLRKEAAEPGSQPIKVVFLVDGLAASPWESRGVDTPWGAVLEQVGRRLQWVDARCSCELVDQPELLANPTGAAARAVEGADVVLGVALLDPGAFDACVELDRTGALASVKVRLFFECDARLEAFNKLGTVRSVDASPGLLSFKGKKERRRAAELFEQSRSLWTRRFVDDVVYMLLQVIDEYVAPVAQVGAVNRDPGLKELTCMLEHCAKPVSACFRNETCRQALNCLQDCGLNDQVCSYNCIVQHESPLFTDFALCNLQLNNCLQNFAEAPRRPDPVPAPTFRGEPLDHALAERLFEGHLGDLVDPARRLPWSWRVVAGQNPAYDHFACQFQLYYRDAKARGVFWYDPVFRVDLDGEREPVWRRRHYRVRRRRNSPGTFDLSVLDNGVTSNEWWRIVAADEGPGLEWALFFYSGAAQAAGLAYSGAILVSHDGNWPSDAAMPAVEDALRAAGMYLWELYPVKNDGCSPPDELMRVPSPRTTTTP